MNRAGHLGDAVGIAEKAARKHQFSFVRAHVLAGMPFVAAVESIDGDLPAFNLHAHAAVLGKIADAADAVPVVGAVVRLLCVTVVCPRLNLYEVRWPAGGALLSALDNEVHTRLRIVA